MTISEDVKRNAKERINIPKQAFDMEYSTMERKEYEWLKKNGFMPAYIKKTSDYGLKIYKYTKSGKLFACIADYYNQKAMSKLYEKYAAAADNAAKEQSKAFADRQVSIIA